MGEELICYENGAGDGFDGEDGVFGNGFAETGGEVGDVVVVVFAGLCEGADGGEALFVELLEVVPAGGVGGEF